MSSKVKTQFVNTSNIKTSVKGIMSIIKKMRETPRRYPDHPIQVAVENYNNLQNGQYVWFGHDSLMFKLNNKIIMVDPIFHNAALAKPFKYTQTFDLSLFPVIDCLILTHSHYDHICKQTLKLLKVLTVFTPLNNTKHINSILKNVEIHELDWFQSYNYEDIKFTCVPGQHFSARTGCDRNESLWGGFCINDIYVSGDTGFNEKMFQNIHKQLPNIKYCFLENGQYSESWEAMHMLPKQTYRAFEILEGVQMFPIHFGKFCLTTHEWDEPAKYALQNAENIFAGQIGKIYTLSECIGKKYIDKSLYD
ncbi:Beta-lactamase_superfamily domain-containing protein [Hexamita inflata]|uniref:Beta-lactamase superfamily domain-containing protein n=1 Tax=Hexamita inflata TaxID=28002 RepID=A0AA86NBL8_9EUKA|nr:Beta-lactamase superfamily domain-containing protein [Hexamita inflata]